MNNLRLMGRSDLPKAINTVVTLVVKASGTLRTYTSVLCFWSKVYLVCQDDFYPERTHVPLTMWWMDNSIFPLPTGPARAYLSKKQGICTFYGVTSKVLLRRRGGRSPGKWLLGQGAESRGPLWAACSAVGIQNLSGEPVCWLLWRSQWWG